MRCSFRDLGVFFDDRVLVTVGVARLKTKKLCFQAKGAEKEKVGGPGHL